MDGGERATWLGMHVALDEAHEEDLQEDSW